MLIPEMGWIATSPCPSRRPPLGLMSLYARCEAVQSPRQAAASQQIQIAGAKKAPKGSFAVRG